MKEKQLSFTEAERKEAREGILRSAYCEYAGVKQLPICKKWDYYDLLDCAESDMRNSGRDLEKEVQEALEEDLFQEIKIALFGQWYKYKQANSALQKVRKKFGSEHELYEFIIRMDCKERNSVRGFFTYTEDDIAQDKYFIFSVYTGVSKPCWRKWGR